MPILVLVWCDESEELRRKSWVIAMPMEAKEREVRSQARNVLSRQGDNVSNSLFPILT